MRKFIAFVLLIAVSINTVLASSYTISDLSSEARDYYIRNALSVQTELNTQSYSSSLFTPLWGSSYVGSSSTHGKTETDWTPFYGPSEIDKRTFFEIAGAEDMLKAFDEAEEKYAKKQRTGAILFGVGIAGIIASLVATGVALECDDVNTSEILFGGSIACACASIAPFCVGAVLVSAKPNNNISVEFAIGIADGYNQKLIDKLMAK